MPQLNHTIDMPIARGGLVADSSEVQDTITRLAEDAAGALAGSFVAQGTDTEKQAVVPTTAAEITTPVGLGVVMLDMSKEPAKTAAAVAAGNEYDIEDALPIFQKGRIWVRCDVGATITPGTQAFVRYAAGAGGSVLGLFREDVDTASAAALPNAVFRSAHKDVSFDGDVQRVALVDLNLPSV